MISEGKLICSQCGHVYPHETTDDLSLLEHAQADGWGFGYNGEMEGDLCPKCVRSAEAQR